MKQQLDIFGESQKAGSGERKAEGVPASDGAPKPTAKQRRARKKREAKKAPMLVDACRQEGKGEELLEQGKGNRDQGSGRLERRRHRLPRALKHRLLRASTP